MKSKKCIYCSSDENEDIPDNHPNIINFTEDITIKKPIKTDECDIEIHIPITISPFVDFWGDGKLVLDLECMDFDGHTLYGTSKSFLINYCPMCGRQLKHG